MIVFGVFCLISSSNWLSIYLTIELFTLCFFILIARGSGYSVEAGLKYFILGALSSGLFLFGCALLCGIGANIHFSHIELLFNSKQVFSAVSIPIGYLLIIVALFFKLSVAPFHMWVPDVYEGAPTKIVLLLAIVPKIGFFSLIISIGLPVNFFFLGILFSLFVGALGALNQTKIKRLLAYSGIGHMGFILWGLENGSFESLQASLVYLFIYIVMTICAFSIILSFNVYKNLLVEFSGLSRYLPFFSITLGVLFFSIAGIPPFAGFFGKWFILLSGILSKSYFIFFFAVFCSVIAGVYYIRIIKILFFQKNSFLLITIKALKKESKLNFKKVFLIGFCFYFILFFFLSPHFLFFFFSQIIFDLF
ncbi:NADH dehydrogenase subunit 2 (mitochondrion) [Stylophora pistillata]|uniref:NADH:ubiquinone reductase (H(+)-translocating) n=1 Tax=Stylophora pistillata TaxID=50429 RepID=B5L5L6_STYPI|nr:NADH dehydrogenase subunit 2 [Stylophora pistillata]ACA84095.1 NADH dehydrogenase subunit 2 [Stylophora pistillata]